MKIKINTVLCTLAFAAGIAGCKKNDATPLPSNSLTIVNAMWTSDTLVTDFHPGSKTDSFRYYKAAFIQPNSYQQFNAYIGITPLQLSPYYDSTRPVYSSSLNLAPGAIYSLFIAGSRQNPDSLFTTDKIPVITDTASFGIRFVNLLTGNVPVSIDTNSGSSLISQLPYKAVTGWQFLSTAHTASGYPTYQINFRNTTTSHTLATSLVQPITPNGVSFYGRCITLVLKGNADSTGQNGPAVVSIHNF
ncbi:MAG: hypothetical protein JST42_00240 [Bacteroidetes bacterium]|nr:hypothetical protein [Bacteroidota bacterium]